MEYFAGIDVSLEQSSVCVVDGTGKIVREVIGDPTYAAAILDRLVHNAHRLTLNGDSMRKTAAKRAGLDVNLVA